MTDCTPRPNASLNSFMDEILLGGMEMGMSSHYSMNGERELEMRNEKLEMVVAASPQYKGK